MGIGGVACDIEGEIAALREDLRYLLGIPALIGLGVAIEVNYNAVKL